MNIPLVDVAGETASLRGEIDGAIAAVVSAGDFVLGQAVGRFERAFADWTDSTRAIGVGNGTDAVEIALRACGIRSGDEVLVPANTFVATAIGVLRSGAIPVFVDCDEATFLVDLDAAAGKVTTRTRAFVAVHLYGRLADPESLLAFSRAHRLLLIEDAAQAHGARVPSGRAGSIGSAAAWSFYPAKNLGALGDAGAVTTCDEEIARRAATLRNYGSPRRYEHPEFGFNSRLDTLQAAVLEVKLPHVDGWNARRREIAAGYRERIARFPSVHLPEDPAGQSHVWHQYVIRVPRRDAVLERLHEAGVGAQIHYPTPVPFLGAVAAAGLASRGDFPVAERLAGEILSLPMYPGLKESQIDRVCDALGAALES